MLFTVVGPSRSQIYEAKTPFVLQQDNWNDFSFQTQYHLHYRDGKNPSQLCGTVKILRRGQKPTDGLQLQPGQFDALDDDFCSVGQSLDYYERLGGLPNGLRDTVLTNLRDIVLMPELRGKFREEEGWGTSLFRYISENDEFLELARILLTQSYSSLPEVSLNTSFTHPDWENPLDFDFDAPEPENFDLFFRRAARDGRPSPKPLPKRIAVLIGRNGSGKSTLLARFARVAYASPADRERETISKIGVLEPKGLGFTRIIAISYSAFDSFEVPGLSRQDREQIARDLDGGVGRYIFCGLRDIAEELRQDFAKAGSVQGSDDFLSEDRRDTTLLKPIEKLADEFERLVAQIASANKLRLFHDALEPLLREPSFDDTEDHDLESLLVEQARSYFLGRSTGHKIVLHVVASVVAHTERKSIVLFDEPETHLHPPLLAALMHSVRIVLDETDAFAIVATHSPVVLQESLAKHVRVVRREGLKTQIEMPSSETFGENVGALTYEIFQLTADTTDFRNALNTLVELYDSLEAIEELFESGLSAQGRAYVMSRMAEKGDADE